MEVVGVPAAAFKQTTLAAVVPETKHVTGLQGELLGEDVNAETW